MRILADPSVQDRALGVTGVFTHLLPPWLIVAMLSPLVWRFTAGITFSRGRMLAPLFAHVAGALSMCVAHYSLLALLFYLRDGFPFFRMTRTLVGSYLLMDVLLYATIAGAGGLWRARRALAQREQNALALRASLSEARLLALKAQLQPHFLFNSLNTVCMLVRKKDNGTAVNMLTDLSELLRCVLRDADKHETSLSDDVALAKRYLALEQLRFRDRLHVIIDVPSALGTASVPALLLQPLVENAVRHGVSANRGTSTVWLRARRDADTLSLEVENDAPLRIRDARSHDYRSEDHALQGGVGLANTTMRLAQLYGDAGRLELTSTSEGNALVRVSIPLRGAA